jgi:integrase/recombinase XerD
MDFQKALADFLRHGQTVRNLSDRTLRAYESDLMQFSSTLPGRAAVGITEDELESYVETLGNGPYRDTSVRRKVAALKVFFRFLEESGAVAQSPARRLRIRQPVETRVPNVLSLKEIKSLLLAPKRQIEMLAGQRDASPGGRNRFFCAVRDNVIIELLFSTGIRIGELVTLDVSDVDCEQRRLKITGRATRGRDIELASDIVFSALCEYLELREERGLENPALFVGRSGTRLTIYSIENIFKKHVRQAEIKRHVTPHALRHTMASMLVSSGADLRSVQEMLGHASILSTQVYTKLTTPKVKRSAAALNQRDRIILEGSSQRLTIRKSGAGGNGSAATREPAPAVEKDAEQ